MAGKAGLRRLFIEKREAITRSAYWAMNDHILQQVALVDWTVYKTIHIFLPASEKKEVDTFSILDYFKQSHPEIKIAVPRTDFENNLLVHVLYDPVYTILGRNKYNIPEPIHGKLVPSSKIDAVIVPLLVFDFIGNRIGYGKGFYDRFLSQCRPEVKKIGLSFFDPVDKINDMNEQDIPLDCCITPDKIWEFQTSVPHFKVLDT